MTRNKEDTPPSPTAGAKTLRVLALSKRSASKGGVEYLEYSARIFILDEMDLVKQACQIAPNLSKGSPAHYIGSTLDFRQRVTDHVAGIGCKTTRDDRQQSLLLVEPHLTFAAARKREAQIKCWSQAKKEALIAGDRNRLMLLSKSRDWRGG